MSHGRDRTRAGTIARCSLLLLAAAAVGCRVGPDYRRPGAPLAGRYVDADDPRLLASGDSRAEWWTVFEDPALTGIVEQASSRNLTLRAAGMRILEARARLGVARGNRFPQLQELLGEYGRVELSDEVANPFPRRGFDQINAGLNAAWEIDFWGRFARAIEAADANLDASAARYDEVLVLLRAETARSYIRLRTFEERLRLAEENLRLQQNVLDLAEARFRNGAVTELDVHQARQNVQQTEALIPILRADLRRSNNAICTLIGRPPEDLLPELGRGAPIPRAPAAVAVGIPAELLHRRPDVRRAERELAAQSAEIGVATAELYPRIAITGTIQVEAEDVSNLLTQGSLAGLIGPGLRWNILNYGRIRNNIRAEDAVFKRLFYEYQQTVLDANREVEDALIGFLTAQDRVLALEESVASAESALTLVVNQYRGGIAEFDRVFLQQAEVVRQQDDLAAAQGALAESLISVYESLGGGWRTTTMPGAPMLSTAEDGQHSDGVGRDETQRGGGHTVGASAAGD